MHFETAARPQEVEAEAERIKSSSTLVRSTPPGRGNKAWQMRFLRFLWGVRSGYFSGRVFGNQMEADRFK